MFIKNTSLAILLNNEFINIIYLTLPSYNHLTAVSGFIINSNTTSNSIFLMVMNTYTNAQTLESGLNVFKYLIHVYDTSL